MDFFLEAVFAEKYSTGVNAAQTLLDVQTLARKIAGDVCNCTQMSVSPCISRE